jgi:hypothetical protein
LNPGDDEMHSVWAAILTVPNYVDSKDNLNYKIVEVQPGSRYETRPRTRKGRWGAKLLVAWGGIEPPTQGFSILCSTD